METLFLIAILIFSVVIHEVAHGVAANTLGDPTAKLQGRLTLNPLPHIDPIGSLLVPFVLSLLPGGLMLGWAKPVPYNPYNLKAGRMGPAIVAFAGPLSNILLALLFVFVVRFPPVLGVVLSPSFIMLSGSVVLINLILAFFNLIPIPPLDGSKILFSVLPYRYHYLEGLTDRYWFFLIIGALFLWNYLALFVYALAGILLGGSLAF